MMYNEKDDNPADTIEQNHWREAMDEVYEEERSVWDWLFLEREE